MTDVDIRLFGRLRLSVQGRSVEINRRQLRAVLTILALSPNHPVSNELLVEGLWGASQPGDAIHALHVYVSRLRRIDGSLREVLVTRPRAYELDVAPKSVDISQFANLVELTRRPDQDAEELARTALSLWQGQPLLEFQYEEFAQPEIRRLARLRREVIVRGSEAALDRGIRVAEWVGILESSVEESPADDSVWRTLVACYERLGDETRANDARWRRNQTGAQEPIAAVQSRSSPIEHIVPAGPRLIGRDRELDDLTGLLNRHRLVTIVGPPGAGKTRLAQNIAASSELPARFAALADFPTLAEAVSSALGIPAIPGSPTTESLAKYSSRDEALLVLDNCEPVVEEAAEYVRQTGVHAPGLRLIATSRAPLLVPDEEVYLLEGLSTDAENDEQLSPAAKLLSIRLGGSVKNTSKLNQIAEQLDGIPLALEVVAANMSQLSAEQILERVGSVTTLTKARLRGVPQRHTTLERALSESVETLSQSVRMVLRRIGRFSGSFSEEDAVALVPELDHSGVTAALDELVTNSLLTPLAHGYQTLWVIAAFTRAMAPDLAEKDRSLHAYWVADKVAGLAPSVYTSEALLAHQALDEMASDIEEAINHATRSTPRLAARIASDLAWHWHVRGHWHDRLQLATSVVQASKTELQDLRLGAWCAQMILEFDLRDFRGAAASAERILAESRRTGYDRGIVLGDAMIAAIQSTTGDRDRGLQAAERAQKAAEASSDPWLQCMAWFAEASIHIHTATHPRAVELCQRIADTPDTEPVLWSTAAYILAADARDQGDTVRASQLIDLSVALNDELGDSLFRPLARLEQAMIMLAMSRPVAAFRTLMPIVDETLRGGDLMAGIPCLDGLAKIALHLGKYETATKIHASVVNRRRNSPWEINPWDSPRMSSSDVLVLKRELAPDRYQKAFGLGASLGRHDLAQLGWSLAAGAATHSEN